MPATLSVPLHVTEALGTVDSFQMLLSQYSSSSSLLRGVEDFLMVVGLIYVSKVVVVTLWDVCVGLRAMVFSRCCRGREHLKKKYGPWAIVTGCTDGIGKAYCHELAGKNGLNLVLISRSLDKLTTLAGDLTARYGVEVEVVVADFTEGRSVYPRIATHLEGKEIGILVNNVGVMTSHLKPFEETTEDELWAHVTVNMGCVCAMTALVLSPMLGRGRGAVVNIASIAAVGPCPLLAVYSASKVFVEYFSLALESEYGSKGIHVQTVCPAYVATNMTSFSSWVGTPSPLTPTAAQFARCAVPTIGYTTTTTGYWTHGVQKWFADKMPRRVFMFFMKGVNTFLQTTVRTDVRTDVRTATVRPHQQ